MRFYTGKSPLGFQLGMFVSVLSYFRTNATIAGIVSCHADGGPVHCIQSKLHNVSDTWYATKYCPYAVMTLKLHKKNIDKHREKQVGNN